MRSIKPVRSVRRVIRQQNIQAIFFFLVVLCIYADSSALAARFFFIERPKLGAVLSYEHEKDERKGPERDETGRTNTYSETIKIETEGYIYHPAFIIYSLTLSPELEQTRKKQFGRTDESHSFLDGYAADMEIFQYKPYTVNLYGNKYSETLRGNLAERTKIDSTAYGSTLNLSYQALPTSLSYHHVESDQSGQFLASVDSDLINLRMSRSESFTKSTLNASYLDRRQKNERATTDTARESYSFQNNLFLRKDRKASLNSSLNYIDTANTNLPGRRFLWNELFSLAIRKNLNTTVSVSHNYDDLYDRTNNVSSRSENDKASFSLNHVLYDNLVTSVSSSVNKYQFAGNKQIDYAGDLRFNYTRDIPRGKLNLYAGRGITFVDVRKTSEFSRTSESKDLIIGLYTKLANPNITESTIEVFYPDRDTSDYVYQKGVHYEIRPTGSITEIICINRFPNPDDLCGKTVTVEYQYRTRFPFDYTLTTQSYGINLHLFSSLDLYSSIRRSKQKIERGIKEDALIDDTTTLYGATLALKRSKTNVELEDIRTQTGLPTRRLTFKETLTFRPVRSTFLEASYMYGHVLFKETDETDRYDSQNVNIQRLVSSWGKLTIEWFRRNVRGSETNTTDTGVSTILEGYYNIYEWTMDFTFQEEEDKIFAETYKNTYFMFKIKRNLF